MKKTFYLLAAASALGSIASAQAAVIPGPVLFEDGAGWTVTGLGFSADDNSTLTGFTYQNQGQADTIVLTDSAGTILDSINTPAGVLSDTVAVDWALQSGQTYFLLQTVVANELFAPYGLPLPSDADITIVNSGTFDYSIAGAVTGENFPNNEFWAGFNDITTGGAAVPEPTAWAMMLVGMGVIGFAMRRRQSVSVAYS